MLRKAILFSLVSQYVISQDDNSIFHIPRIPDSCTAVSVTSSNSTLPISSLNVDCATFNWSDINNLLSSFTSYLDHQDNQNYDAYIGTVTVYGQIGGYNLDYQCPPHIYNIGNEGTQYDVHLGSKCNATSNSQLVIVHRRTIDNKIYKIHVIRSGAPFPTALLPNEGPYGTAVYEFPNGLGPQVSGSLQICENAANKNPVCSPIDTNKLLSLKDSQSTNINGVYMVGPNMKMRSDRVQDDVNNLLILTAGVQALFFNNSGTIQQYFDLDKALTNCYQNENPFKTKLSL